jgi:hypothetical protein
MADVREVEVHRVVDGFWDVDHWFRVIKIASFDSAVKT